MSRPLKFGLIGCGRVSERHLAALTSGTLSTDLVAVTDAVESKARSKGDKYGVAWHTDYHRMMRAHPDLDVITIATPTGYHARHVLDLAPYGKHLVVEKPMALRVKDCDAMIRACRRHGCRLFVVQQNRFNPAVVAARTALERGRFGRLVMGTVRVRWCRDQAYYDQDDWHGTWALDGGVIAQQASHHLDLLQWFLGPIRDMQCRTATRVLSVEVEDTALALLRFESGALGAFEATVAARPRDLEGSLSLLGERGSVVVAGPAVNRIEHWEFGDPEPGDEEMTQRASQDMPDVYGHGHEPFLAAVTAAILEDRPFMLEAPEGRKNVEILTALYESAARDGATVRPGCRIRLSRLGRAATEARGPGRHGALG
jgi:predicted dehydrogenase